MASSMALPWPARRSFACCTAEYNIILRFDAPWHWMLPCALCVSYV
jgi:hypothetical protein